MWAYCLLVIAVTFSQGLCNEDIKDYMEERFSLLGEELDLSLGWNLTLTSEEMAFNDLLMKEKVDEMSESFASAKFPPAASFLETWRDYDSSKVFQILKSIPKGSVLHLHLISMTSIDWVVNNATYRDNLYMRKGNGTLEFKFMTEEKREGWESVKKLRELLGNAEVDRTLRRELMMGVDFERYETINDKWVKFSYCLSAVRGIVTYKPVFVDYMLQGLTEFLNDGVQYTEVRTTIPPVYDLDGTSLDPVETTRLIKETAEKFAAANPEWCGTKMIYAPVRFVPESSVVEYLELARQLTKTFPDFVVGFDLVAQEDLGRPLFDFIGPLLEASKDLTYFFHAGETDWDYSSTDLNLADALLLNTSRIGHGYAIDKHPKLMEMAIAKDIPIEVNPISNQVLGLVSDLRNHPASNLVKTSFPMVISSDDPPVWGALPLSHDMYAAFLAIGGDSADLRFLKQMILNSFKYSKMNKKEMGVCAAKFEKKWTKALREILYSSHPIIELL